MATAAVTSSPATATPAAAAAVPAVAAVAAPLTVAQLREWLVDEKQPIAKRMRCCFKLRQLGGHDAIDALAAGKHTTNHCATHNHSSHQHVCVFAPIAVSSPSVLLGHEIAFVLGQMQDRYAVPFLTKTLENRAIDPIVRHEVISSPTQPSMTCQHVC